MYDKYDDNYDDYETDYFEPHDFVEDSWAHCDADAEGSDYYDDIDCLYRDSYDFSKQTMDDEEYVEWQSYGGLNIGAQAPGDFDEKLAGLDLGVIDFIFTIIPPLMLVRMLVDVIACLFQRRPIREGRYIQFITKADGIDWSNVSGP